MRTTLCSLTRCIAFAVALLAMAIMAAPAFAQNNCLQDEFTAAGNHQTLGCTANDVRVAQVVNVRDLTGKPLTTCFQGSTFSFLADFEIVTSSTSSRSNIGLYFATQNQATALTGSCVDNIISPLHQCPGASTGILCGSDNFHELDAAPDTCGDTSSSDKSPVFGAAAEGVTVVVNNFLCQAPAGSTTLQLPNCTSWQVPGKTILCETPAPNYPYEVAAIPGTTSKCNCGTIALPITPVSVTATAQKACTTSITTGPAAFTSSTQSPTSCDEGAEGVDPATYYVNITATETAGNGIVDQICDTAYGTIYDDDFLNSSNQRVFPTCKSGTVGGSLTNNTCASGLTLSGTAPGQCQFTAPAIGELTSVTDQVTASGHSSINLTSTFTTPQSDSVTVSSEDAPSTATVTKGVVGTEAACATVRYSVNVQNTSGADETLKLSSLTDTAYGDITNLGSGTPPTVLGTTCGQASGGLGTLAGSTGTGGGALPATLSVGAVGAPGTFYTCQFDAQFCSALSSGCIQNVDKVTGTLTGDEGETVTQTGNTITVKECLTSTVTSTTP